jgi:hypothetical protein
MTSVFKKMLRMKTLQAARETSERRKDLDRTFTKLDLLGIGIGFVRTSCPSHDLTVTFLQIYPSTRRSTCKITAQVQLWELVSLC